MLGNDSPPHLYPNLHFKLQITVKCRNVTVEHFPGCVRQPPAVVVPQLHCARAVAAGGGDLSLLRLRPRRRRPPCRRTRPPSALHVPREAVRVGAVGVQAVQELPLSALEVAVQGRWMTFSAIASRNDCSIVNLLYHLSLCKIVMLWVSGLRNLAARTQEHLIRK